MEEFYKQFDFEIQREMTFAKGNIDKLVLENRVIEDMKRELKSNSKYKEFFDQFSAESVEEFINFIARLAGKVSSNQYLIEFSEGHKIKEYRKRAGEGLWEIQQKKLFNLQCLWRAGKIEIEEVKCSRDFLYHEKTIKICPFLEPITEEEVDLYRQYILTDDFTFEMDVFKSWQDYDTFKYEYQHAEELSETPEWYLFYDSRKGTGSYLILPDLKGQKEDIYEQMAQKQDKEYKAAIQSIAPVHEKHIDITDMYQLCIDFAWEFEDSKTADDFHKLETFQRMIDYKNNGFEDHGNSGIIEHVLWELRDVEEKIPVHGYFDWKEALIKIHFDYEIRKVEENMSIAYEEYKMRLDLGIPVELTDNEIQNHKQWYNNMDGWRQRILTGRAIMDEPQDFDY